MANVLVVDDEKLIVKGIRFSLEQDLSLIHISVWPEPYGYDATPPEQKTSEYFPFTRCV